MTMNDDDSVPDGEMFFAVVLLLSSLICLGTWPALLRSCSFKDQNERVVNNDDRALLATQNRHPCHVYLDYSIAYVAFSITVPFLVERIASLSSSPSSSDDDASFFANVRLAAVASIGGSLLSVGNSTTQWATTVFSMPLTTVLAAQASTTVVLGTFLNYALEPNRTNRPSLLAWGVSAFLTAVVLSVVSQSLYERDRSSPSSSTRVVVVASDDDGGRSSYYRATERDHRRSDDASSSSAPLDFDGSESRLNTTNRSSSFLGVGDRTPSPFLSKGMTVTMFGGLCFGLFSPAFNVAVNDPFGWTTTNDVAETTKGGKRGLSVPSANAWFGVAFAATSVVWNSFLVRRTSPSLTSLVGSSDHHSLENHDNDRRFSSSGTWSEYLTSQELSERSTALWAGVVCALGNVLQFQGGRLAGYAASDLVQAFPLVATIWDVVVFKEFAGASRRVLISLFAMYASYVAGIVLMVGSVVAGGGDVDATTSTSDERPSS